jgi:hypothetical protein
VAEKASAVAKIALLVSTGTAIFSAFQWWSSRQESRITAAIEISRNYIRDRDINTTSMLFALATGVKFDPEPPDMLKIGHHADFLEYVALLTLTNKLDKAYLAPALICDITNADAALRIVGKRFWARPLESKITQFSRDNPCQASLTIPEIPK